MNEPKLRSVNELPSPKFNSINEVELPKQISGKSLLEILTEVNNFMHFENRVRKSENGEKYEFELKRMSGCFQGGPIYRLLIEGIEENAMNSSLHFKVYEKNGPHLGGHLERQITIDQSPFMKNYLDFFKLVNYLISDDNP